MQSGNILCREAVARLKEIIGAGVSDNSDCDFEVREIIREVTGSVISGADTISNSGYEQCRNMALRRQKGEPLQYIFGHWEFYGEDFLVGEGVLIPRPETELLCEKAIKLLKNSGGCFVDLCSGSGCIAATVARHTGLKGYAVELSEAALPYLYRNIENVTPEPEIINGDVLSADIADRFSDNSLSAVLSNPPYITSDEMRTLQKEVLKEPHMALCGGYDGLDFYRGIVRLWTDKLVPGGFMLFEIGEAQGKSVSDICKGMGMSAEVFKDYAGQDRMVLAVKP